MLQELHGLRLAVGISFLPLALPGSLARWALARWHRPASRSTAEPCKSARCAAQMVPVPPSQLLRGTAARDCSDALHALRRVIAALLFDLGIGARRPGQLSPAKTLAAQL